MVSVLDAHTILEKELPREKMRSNVTVWGEEIVSTDDPRWIECERAVVRAWEAETDAACALIRTRPTTLAGVIALLQYANAADVDGETWPRDNLVSDDGTTRSWHYFLVEMLAEVLPEFVSS